MTVTVADLRAALQTVPRTFDHLEVEIWLPGSTIYLETQGRPERTFLDGGAKYAGKILIEGNVRSGSALDDPPVTDMIRALQFARKEIVHRLKSNATLIKSSQTIAAIDAVLTKAGVDVYGGH